jgi:hypothetical protein
MRRSPSSCVAPLPGAKGVSRAMGGRSHLGRGTSVSVAVLVAQLCTTDAEKSALRRRAAALREECGCATGAGFGAAALVLTPLLLWLTSGFSVVGLALCAGVVFAAALVGKATGVLVARGQLFLLGLRLRRRVRLERSGRVFVH